MKGLEVLDDVSALEVKTRVGNFVFTPVKMGKLKLFANTVAPMINEVMAFVEQQGNILELIDKHEHTIIDLVTMCSDFKQTDYENLYADEFVAIVTAAIEVNMDFFVQNLLPRVRERLAGLKENLAKLKETGATVSSALLATATPPKKSKNTRSSNSEST